VALPLGRELVGVSVYGGEERGLVLLPQRRFRRSRLKNTSEFSNKITSTRRTLRTPSSRRVARRALRAPLDVAP
jgi:hypothetical protein